MTISGNRLHDCCKEILHNFFAINLDYAHLFLELLAWGFIFVLSLRNYVNKSCICNLLIPIKIYINCIIAWDKLGVALQINFKFTLNTPKMTATRQLENIAAAYVSTVIWQIISFVVKETKTYTYYNTYSASFCYSCKN